MRVGILGPLEVSAGDRPVEVGGARLRKLLTVLALAGGRVVPFERLIDDMWDDQPPAGAPNALQSLVSRLRSAIGREAVESHPAGYRLNAEVDVREFEDLVGAARNAGPAERSAALRAALALWRGPALADVAGEQFAEGHVARLHALRRTALLNRAEADLALGRHAEVVPELEGLLALDPLSEPAAALLMKALYGMGRQADALEVYTSVREALSEELGVDPSPDLEEAHLAVLRQEAAVRPQRASPTNLRTRLTSFIGRDDDLERLAKLVGLHRLVTLTGPGGAGKTSLAEETARRVLERMDDGAWLVELAPVTVPAEVPHAVLAALGLRETVMAAATPLTPHAEDPDALDRLCLALRARKALLVLDNCEHLIDTAAQVADRILASCPGIRILATSREPLGITGEVLCPVEPLPLPEPDADVVEAQRSPAVRLFVERGADGRPGFMLTPENVGFIVDICRHLDGMPLALELAAARLRGLTPQQISERLSDRFRLLSAGSRTAMPRHQTLRAVVGWSWDLLTPDEQRLWRALSLFTGGTTLESAEAVCGLPDTLELLTALVDKSLLLMLDDGRYRMLETIREYGLERLAEAGEDVEIRKAYAEYFTRLAERAEPEMRGRDQVRWMNVLLAEHDNLHTALRCSIQAGDGALAIRMCAALGWYWWMRTHRRESVEAITAAIRLPGIPEDQTTALALGVGGMAALGASRDFEEIQSWLVRSHAIVQGTKEPIGHPMLRLLGPITKLLRGGSDETALAEIETVIGDPDPWLRAMARIMCGQVRLNLGRTEGVEEHYRSGLAEFRSVGDRWGTSFALSALAELMAWRGDHRTSAALCEEALQLAEEFGNLGYDPRVHMQLARELWLLDERERALELMEQVARITARIGDAESTASVHFQLAEFDRLRGDPASALRRLDRAVELYGPLNGPPQFHSLIMAGRGSANLLAGDLEAAASDLAEALDLGVTSHDFPVIAAIVVAHAALAWRRSADGVRAATLLGAAEGLRGGPDLSSAEAVRLTAEVREALGPAFDDEFGKGRAFDLPVVREYLENR